MSTKLHEAKKNTSPVKLAVVLTSICVVTALLLGAVNYFTYAKIEENTEASMLSSIKVIFDSSVDVVRVDDLSKYPDLTTMYLVTKGGAVCGVAAASAPSGFGGPINMMVGVDSAGAVIGVQIISMSETPGLGSRTSESSFLDRFIGKSGKVAVGDNIDGLSGATISSKAVTAGVQSVLSSLTDIASIASEHNMETVPYTKNEAAQTTAVAETVAVTEAVTEAPATEAEQTSVDIAVTKGVTPPENIIEPDGDAGKFDVAESETATAEYETLTTESETTVPEDVPADGF